MYFGIKPIHQNRRLNKALGRDDPFFGLRIFQGLPFSSCTLDSRPKNLSAHSILRFRNRLKCDWIPHMEEIAGRARIKGTPLICNERGIRRRLYYGHVFIYGSEKVLITFYRYKDRISWRTFLESIPKSKRSFIDGR